jgi:ribonuclease HII
VRSSTRSRFHFERSLLAEGVEQIAGVDEAGRGPLAGPVVAAAVVFPTDWIRGRLPFSLRGLNDSKQLTAEEREEYYLAITTLPGVRHAVSVVEVEDIDRLNILRASHLAMLRALEQIVPDPQHVLVDGLRVAAIRHPQTPIVEGDSRSYSIAAASVLAKVTRDRIMLEYHRRWPMYGFASHKGYPTPQHAAALAQHGPCPIHRRSFAPVSNAQLELFAP